MKNFLIVYYGRMKPTFIYAGTVEEARSYAQMVLTSQYSKPSDILSIVEVSTDIIIDYGKRDELLIKYSRVEQPAKPFKSVWSFSLKPVLNWISLKLARPTIG
jgi:hypothetical protein